MNHGMIALYAFFGINILISSRLTKQPIIFWGGMLNMAITVLLLAWSHGWHMTWEQ